MNKMNLFHTDSVDEERITLIKKHTRILNGKGEQCTITKR